MFPEIIYQKNKKLALASKLSLSFNDIIWKSHCQGQAMTHHKILAVRLYRFRVAPRLVKIEEASVSSLC